MLESLGAPPPQPGSGPAPGITRSKAEGKPGKETDGKAKQRRKLGVGVTQLEWREVHHDSFWMVLNGVAGREERQRMGNCFPPPSPQIFIAFKSPGLTQGLAAS